MARDAGAQLEQVEIPDQFNPAKITAAVIPSVADDLVKAAAPLTDDAPSVALNQDKPAEPEAEPAQVAKADTGIATDAAPALTDSLDLYGQDPEAIGAVHRNDREQALGDHNRTDRKSVV